MTLVIPARIVSDGVDAEAFNGHAGISRCRDLMPHDAKPCWAEISLDTCLSDEHRSAEPAVYIRQQIANWPMPRVIDRDR